MHMKSSILLINQDIQIKATKICNLSDGKWKIKQYIHLRGTEETTYSAMLQV